MRRRANKRVLALAACLLILLLILFSSQLSEFNVFKKKGELTSSPERKAPPAMVEQIIPDQKAVTGLPEEIPEEFEPTIGPMAKGTPVAANFEPAPYILLLGSFRTLSNVKSAASSCQKKGIGAHWNHIDLENDGIWYRMFTGGFRTIAEARQYKKNNGLGESIIISAPWTVSVGLSNSFEDLDAVRSVLRDNQYDFYSESFEDDGARIMIGAYKTQAGAERLAQEVAKLNLMAEAALR